MARAPGYSQWLPLPYGRFGETLRDPLGFQMRARERFGDVYRIRIGPLLVHWVFHPDQVQHVLCDHQKNYPRGWQYDILRRLTGENLVTSEGAYWKRQRRLAQPAFHRSRMPAYVEQMVEATARMREAWSSRPADRPLDVGAEMSRLALGIAGRTFFGRDVSAAADVVGSSFDVVSHYIQHRLHYPLTSLPLWVPTPRNNRFREAVRTLQTIVLDLVRERRGEAADRGDLLSMLLRAHDDETGEAMTDAQLTSELLAFFMAGHETTATALTWTWYLLGQHAEETRRVRDEVASVLGDERPSLETLGRLTFTRRAIEEAMRLYPPIAVMPRQAVERDEIGGYEIPAGSTVALAQFVTHRHPDVWERPETYDPDRFLPERSAGRPRFAYFPFLGGPHQCIGMDFALLEMTVVVAMILQQFDVELVPGPEIHPKMSLALYPDRPVQVLLTPVRPEVASGRTVGSD